MAVSTRLCPPAGAPGRASEIDPAQKIGPVTQEHAIAGITAKWRGDLGERVLALHARSPHECLKPTLRNCAAGIRRRADCSPLPSVFSRTTSGVAGIDYGGPLGQSISPARVAGLAMIKARFH